MGLFVRIQSDGIKINKNEKYFGYAARQIRPVRLGIDGF